MVENGGHAEAVHDLARPGSGGVPDVFLREQPEILNFILDYVVTRPDDVHNAGFGTRFSNALFD